jgi:hypothetical protein
MNEKPEKCKYKGNFKDLNSTSLCTVNTSFNDRISDIGDVLYSTALALQALALQRLYKPLPTVFYLPLK